MLKYSVIHSREMGEEKVGGLIATQANMKHTTNAHFDHELNKKFFKEWDFEPFMLRDDFYYSPDVVKPLQDLMNEISLRQCL